MRYILYESTEEHVFDGRKKKKGKETMKKLWRRILILSVMLVMAMSVHAMAKQTQYAAKTISFSSKTKAGWSNQFTVNANTNIGVGINITNKYSGISASVAAQINKRLTYVLENVKTHQQFYLTKHNSSNYFPNTSYEENMTVPAGTYSLGVYYSGSYSFDLYFRIVGEGGIDVPDRIEVLKGTTETIKITQTNSYGDYITIKSCYTDDDDVAEAVRDNSPAPDHPAQVIITAHKLGSTILTVRGSDGSVDQMTILVVKKKSGPTLSDYDLELNAGDTKTIKVNNASGKVTWSTNNSKVATIKQKGKKGYKCQIKAVGHGKAVIKATTTKNGTTYTLACEVVVGRATPNFIIHMTKLVPSKKTVKIKINNKSGAPLYVYKKGLLLDWPDYDDTIRNLTLQNGSTIKIADGKAKTLTFKISGSKLKLDGKTINDFGARIKIKIDGLKYYARCTHDKHLGEYIRTNKLSTDKWQFSYLAYGV